MVVQFVNGKIIEVGAAFVHFRTGHAARQHKSYVDGQVFGGFQHIANAVHAHNVGNFVRVGHDGGGAVPNDRFGKFRRGNQTAFQMNMRVDKSGQNDFSLHVELCLARIFAHAGDQSVRYRNVSELKVVGKHVEIVGVFNDEIGRLLPPRNADQLALFFHFARDFACRGFAVCHRVLLRNLFLTIIAYRGAARKSFFAEKSSFFLREVSNCFILPVAEICAAGRTKAYFS